MATVSVRRRRVLGFGLAGLLAIASVGAALAQPAGPRVERVGTVYVVRSERVEYRFDPTFRTEFVDLGPAPVSGTSEDGAARRAAVLSLRAALLRHLGLRDLQEIPQEGETELRALKALGYL